MSKLAYKYRSFGSVFIQQANESSTAWSLEIVCEEGFYYMLLVKIISIQFY